MPTPSIRLSTNLYKTVKNSEFSFSELAREGIEQAVIGDIIGVCWICGEGIHHDSRHMWLDTHRYTNGIAGGEIESPREEWPMQMFEYKEFVERERAAVTDGPPDQDWYYTRLGKWLNLPLSNIVEFCSSCSAYLDKVKKKEIWAAEIPIPYQYRAFDVNIDVEDVAFAVLDEPVFPVLSYAAESAAVCATDYNAYQRSLFDPDARSRDFDRGLFWWAARSRSQNIIESRTHSWLEIALRSNAQCIRTRRPLQPVFEQALQLAIKNHNSWEPGISKFPPGISDTDISNQSERCAACGSGIYDIGANANNKYCPVCFYGKKSCSNNTDECGLLHPRVTGDWKKGTKVEFKCYGCGETELPEKLTKEFWARYEPYLDEIERLIPQSK